MAGSMKGEVVAVPFPFSAFSESKRRPALVVAEPDGPDVILCQITSRPIQDRYAISIDPIDFDEGRLRVPCNVRPNRLFTADIGLILYRIGRITVSKMAAVTAAIERILRE